MLTPPSKEKHPCHCSKRIKGAGRRLQQAQAGLSVLLDAAKLGLLPPCPRSTALPQQTPGQPSPPSPGGFCEASDCPQGSDAAD